jgi:hypothetical protein
MSNYSFMTMSHWLEMDAYSDEILEPTALRDTILQIQKNLHYHLVDNIDAELYYSLDVKLFSNKEIPRLFHLIADVQTFSVSEARNFMIPGPGNDIFSQGLPYVPPKPNPPAPLGFTVLHPVTDQFRLSAHVSAISTKLGEVINFKNINAVTM